MLSSILVEILQGLLHPATGQGKDICILILGFVRYKRGLKIISAALFRWHLLLVWSWEMVIIVSWLTCCLHIVLKNFCFPLHLVCPFIPPLCWHNGLQGHTMSSFKKLVRIKNNSKKKMNWGFLLDLNIFNLHETFISCSEYGCMSSCQCNQGGILFICLGWQGAGRLVPLWCSCSWCPAQCSFRNGWDFYVTSLQELHLSTLGEMFLEECLVGLGWGTSDPWEAVWWFRHNNRELSAFGTFQIKTNKTPQPQHRPKMKTFYGFHERQGIISLLLQASWTVEIMLQLLHLLLWRRLFLFCFYLHPTDFYLFFLPPWASSLQTDLFWVPSL